MAVQLLVLGLGAVLRVAGGWLLRGLVVWGGKILASSVVRQILAWGVMSWAFSKVSHKVGKWALTKVFPQAAVLQSTYDAMKGQEPSIGGFLDQVNYCCPVSEFFSLVMMLSGMFAAALIIRIAISIRRHMSVK